MKVKGRLEWLYIKSGFTVLKELYADHMQSLSTAKKYIC